MGEGQKSARTMDHKVIVEAEYEGDPKTVALVESGWGRVNMLQIQIEQHGEGNCVDLEIHEVTALRDALNEWIDQ